MLKCWFCELLRIMVITCERVELIVVFHLAVPQTRTKIVLDGPRSCGKSIALAMLVHWARNEGWLVFYVPKGREWTHGGFFYKSPRTGLWDTPVQATNILKVGFCLFIYLLFSMISFSSLLLERWFIGILTKDFCITLA